jgi:hypothetical protein
MAAGFLDRALCSALVTSIGTTTAPAPAPHHAQFHAASYFTSISRLELAGATLQVRSCLN